MNFFTQSHIYVKFTSTYQLMQSSLKPDGKFVDDDK